MLNTKAAKAAKKEEPGSVGNLYVVNVEELSRSS
jgi:hypothetical protein